MRLAETEHYPLDEEKIKTRDPEERYAYFKTLVKRLNDIYSKIANVVNKKNEIIDRGEASAWDWTLASFTTNGLWHDLDCSAIVPAGAKFIIFQVEIVDDTLASFFYLRKKGRTTVYNVGMIAIEASLIPKYAMMIIPCDENRKVQYQAYNTTWSGINVLIMGWII